MPVRVSMARFVAWWVRTRTEKLEMVATLRAQAVHLEAGPWWMGAPNLGVHVRARGLPRHLRGVMARRHVGVGGAIRSLARALVPPVWVLVRAPLGGWTHRGERRRAHQLGSNVVAFFMPRGRTLVLFDRAGASVTRVGLSGALPGRVVVVRRALQHHVPMPAFHVSSDRTFVREELIDGVPFDRLSATERAEAFAMLLERYARVVGHEARGARPIGLSRAFDAADRRAVVDPVWAELAVRRGAVVAAAASWPCVPSHGDLTPRNLVTSGGEVNLIDFEFADVLPFFYDVVKLALDEASFGRDDLLTGLRPGGQFAVRWQALWVLAGLPGAPASLEPVVLAVIVLYARRLERFRPSTVRRPLLEGSHAIPELGTTPYV